MKVSGYECGYPLGRVQGLADGFATGFTQGVRLAQEVMYLISLPRERVMEYLAAVNQL